MKKIMFFAAVAAVISLASCQKEALNEAAGTESPVFTATISTGTKTTVNATDGKVAWESTDKITITDASAASATYKIKSIDGNTGKATFEVESGTLGQGPYTATYGTEPATPQTYAATPGNLYMTAPATSTNSFTFSVQCGLMEINLTKAGESVKSIAVTGTPTGGVETTYTLTCDEVQSIAEKKPFYIALPAGSYNKIVITDSNDKVCTLTAASGLALENNHIKPVTFSANKLNFLPAGALPGIFTVSAEGKKVYFSKGNLTYSVTDTKWSFYEHQYDRAGNGSASTTLISLFTWGYGKWSTDPITTEYLEGHTSDGEPFNPSEDWGSQIGDGKTWRTLTTAEWQYLFNTRTVNGGQGAGKSYSLNITYGGKWGLVLYPDDYSGSTLTSGTDYTDANFPADCVFLPAAGDRDGSDVLTVGGRGLYWSSTAYVSNLAYRVAFYSSDVNPDSDSRYYGCSVRLITECQ